MLVLTRKNNESVVIGGSAGFDNMIKVTVLEIVGGKVRLGFEGDKGVPVHRWEVWERVAPAFPSARRCALPVRDLPAPANGAVLDAPAIIEVDMSTGFWRRTLAALGGAFKRGLLGKSSSDYLKQFAGSEEYWDAARFAPRGPSKKPPPAPEYEPVHGWTKPQCEDYLERNPSYRATYEAELKKHPRA